MIENKDEILSKFEKFLHTYDENDIIRKEIEKMSEHERLFLSHLLSNITFIRSGIQPYFISLRFFCKVFEIETLKSTDAEIIQNVNCAVATFSRHEIFEDNEYGTRILCGYKISWVSGEIIVSPNPALEKLQKGWKIMQG